MVACISMEDDRQDPLSTALARADDGPTGSPVGPSPAPNTDDELRAEIVELRQRLLRTNLELQIARVSPDARGGVGVDDEWVDEDANWLDRAAGWRWGDAQAVLQRGSATVACVYRHVLPAREGAPAARWVLKGWEIQAFLLILVAAAGLRFYHLSSIPPGVQGDEAASALEGQRVRNEGWIGPYTTVMAGSPTGVIYSVALAQVLLGDSIHTIRAVSAFYGTLTVALLFLLMRRSFGIWPAIAGSSLLAAFGWQIHYSRMGYPNSSWPCIVALGLLCLVEAYRSDHRGWWALAGATMGLGIYTYNSHVLFLLIFGAVFAALIFGPWALLLSGALVLAGIAPNVATVALVALASALFLAGQRERTWRRMQGPAMFGASLVLVAVPMIRYATDDRHDYFGYSRRLSIFNSPEWEAKDGLAAQAGFILNRYWDYWNRLSVHPVFDGVDASGTVPLVPLLTVLLAVAGVGFALWRGNRLAASIGAATMLALPLASVLSVDFALRRTLLLTLFMAMFAGIAVVEIVRIGWRWPLAASRSCRWFSW